MKRPVAHPLVIIGLDGGTFDVLRPLIARGELPHLERLLASGLATELRSTLPPVTLPAWTSFLTGVEPSEHGVTDIFIHPRGSYTLVPASAALRRMPTFLARLSGMGLRVASLGLPGTYPPERLNGIAIAGFDAPGASHARPAAVWPPELWPELERLGGWRYATFNEQHSPSPEQIAQALCTDLDAKERVILPFHRREPWDVFLVHLQASDTAGHHLWHTFDKTSPRYPGPSSDDALPSVYRRIDALIGRLLAQAPANARTLIVSDHGMGGAGDTAVHINRLLHEMGLLQFRSTGDRALRRLASTAVRSAARHLSPALLGQALHVAPPALVARLLALFRHQPVDYARSSAFSDELDYAPTVWLNRRGVFSHGQVDESQAFDLEQRIITALIGLRHPQSGTPLIRAVHRRKDVHQGVCADAYPDLLIEPAWPDGFRPSFLSSAAPGPSVRRLQPKEYVAGRGSGMPGVHRREGVFIANGPGLDVAPLPALDIAAAGAFVYALLGISQPADILQPLPPWLAGQSGATSAADTPPPDPYTDADRLAVTQRLADLGYID